MKIQKMKTQYTQTGFTLIEVLITLVVFAVGLLGLAALQIRSMQFVHDAYIHSQAQVLAYDVLDRMRANRIEALNTNNYILAIANEPSVPGTNCATTACNASQMSQFDVYEWREILKEHLPQGAGAISVTDLGTGGRLYTIDIQWLDDRNREVTDQASFNKRFQTFTFRAEL